MNHLKMKTKLKQQKELLRKFKKDVKVKNFRDVDVEAIHYDIDSIDMADTLNNDVNNVSQGVKSATVSNRQPNDIVVDARMDNQVGTYGEHSPVQY